MSFNEGSGPAQIDRLNRQRQITISANPTPGISQAEGQAATILAAGPARASAIEQNCEAITSHPDALNVMLIAIMPTIVG